MGSQQSSSRHYNEERNGNRNRPPAATAKDVEKALEQQRKLYEERMKDLIRENRQERGATTTATGQQATATSILERQRTPYSYNQNNLQTAIIDPTAQSLYPNLGSGSSTLYPGNSASPSFPNGGNCNQSSADFVFVNSNIANYPQQQHAQRFQPSAPPSESSSTNSRSRSRQRGQQDDDISCPTCGNIFGEKIYQCNQGHSSCNMCKMRQSVCGQCRQQITNRRNFDLEKYVLERRVKCPNSADGCRLFIKMADMDIHAKQCPFKALKCPSLGSYCPWIGKLSQLLDHFNTMHPTHRQADIDKEMVLSNITNASHTMHYIQIGSFNFLFHIKVSEAEPRIYMGVQLIGTKHSAAKWDYEIHVYNKSQPRRKFQYTDRCSSSSEPIQEIFECTKCAVIPIEYAKTLICGGVLAYKFYIKRDEVKTKGTVNKRGGRGPWQHQVQ